MSHVILGKVHKIIFHNASNLFTVMLFRLYELNEKLIFVTGNFPVYEKDTMLECHGLYQEHPKYGMQFVANSIRVIIPQEREALINYLSSPAFVGIGKVTATKVVDALGLDLIEQIKTDPDARYHIPGVPMQKQETIIAMILKASKEDQLVAFITMVGLSMRQMHKIQRLYEDDAILLIKHNPYRLIDDIDGIGFKIADKVAMALGFEEDNPLRMEAAFIDALMNKCMQSGDSFVDVDVFLDDFDRKHQFDLTSATILDQVLLKGKAFLDDKRLYPISQAESEDVIVDFFLKPSGTFKINLDDINTKIADVEAQFNIEFDSEQKHAIVSFFEDDHIIITGGPGTGKTTIVLALLELAKKVEPPMVIETCAPTGRAAKRLTILSNHKANTIHSLLQWDLETNTFNRNEEHPLMVDILIIDEFSMVDTYLFAQLLKAVPEHTKIIMIGDHNQLPSVAPGNVLRDLIQSNICPVITLDVIYRQQSGSQVIELAHNVLKGEFTADFNQDIRFIETTTTQVKEPIIQTIAEALDKGYRIDDIQVLAPKYNGLAGIDALNHALQKAFNPPDTEKRELKVGYKTFREGDKILQLKNQIDDDVYNGDIGTLVEIVFPYEDENNQNRMIVDFEGNFVEYTSDMFINISHAYCMSVHKAQGNEYPIVILLGFREYGWMLQRRLYYTAITRASNYLICMGEYQAFVRAIERTQLKPRKTYLKQRLMVE